MIMASKKYYGVKVGRMPGVYNSWAECQKQVSGYPGAAFKGFATEQEAFNYVQGVSTVEPSCSVNLIPAGKHFDIYVDGSYKNGNYGWAFVVYSGSEVIFSDSGVGTNSEVAAMHNVAGELAATMRAIKWAEQQDIDSVTIHHDYMGIAKWAIGEWKAKNKFTQAYASFVAPYLKWVQFNKVAGHSGVEGNELADKLAGEALKNSG